LSNWPRSLIYILLVAMFGVFPALAASGDTSDEIVHDERFWDQLFVDAVHSREACNLDFKPCRAPLQKRVEDYYLRVRGETKFLSDEVAEAASRSLTRVIEDIYRTTGLRPIQGVPEHASNFIFLLFFNEEEYQSDPENYILARIAPPTLRFSEKRLEVFSWFRSSHLDCTLVTTPYPDGIIRDVQIWIKVDVSTEVVSNCIAEEFFDSFGLDDTPEFESIFDWPTVVDGEIADGKLTERHLSFLRRLYEPEMIPNQAEEATWALIR